MPSVLQSPSLRSRWLAPDPIGRLAQLAIVLAGLSLAGYAVLAFREPDWTIAIPSLVVAVAGALGGRLRPALLAGPVPLVALATVGAGVVAFSLDRPGESAHFVGNVAIVGLSGLAAVLGPWAVVATPRNDARRQMPVLAAGAGVAVAVAVALLVWSSQPASGDRSGAATAEELAAAPVVVLADHAFGPSTIAAPGGRVVVRLRNVGALPHNLHVEELNLTVFVPSGREAVAVIDLPDGSGDVPAWCSVGDHAQLGMTATIATG